MPNHITNKLTIQGPEKYVQEFHMRVTEKDWDDENAGIIRAFLPFPEELKGEWVNDSNGRPFIRAFKPEGYEWCINNWGTKWGDYQTDVLSDPWGIGDDPTWAASYQYLTAWSPANEAIGTISKMQPHLLFTATWTEEGNQSAGAIVCKNGFVVIQTPAYDEYPKWPVDNETDQAIEDYYGDWETMLDNLESKAFAIVSENPSIAN